MSPRTHLTPHAPGNVARGAAIAVFGLIAALAVGGCGGDEPPAEEIPGAVTSEVAEAEPTLAEQPHAARGPRRGLWILAEGSQRVLESTERIETLIADAERIGATDLFVQVYRGGRAWYDSELADPTPYQELRKSTGADGLALLIEAAHARGFRVHAWVNVLSLSHNARAPIVEALGRDSILVDRKGRSLLDYPDYEVPKPDRDYYRMGTPGLSLDPGAPGVLDRLVATFAELLDRYPALDGLHLDYIRHPDVLPLIPGSRFGVGLDFGYGEGSRAKFQRDTGLAAPRNGNMVNLTKWDDWRRDQVTQLVAAIRQRSQVQNPQLELSAAVIAYADRAYLTLAQDWQRWLEEDLLDFAIPMIYTLDDRLLRYQAERFAGPHADRIWAGLGTWLFARNPDRAFEQLEIAQRAGLANHALFSYDSMVDARERGLLERFVPAKAVPEALGEAASDSGDGD